MKLSELRIFKTLPLIRTKYFFSTLHLPPSQGYIGFSSYTGEVAEGAKPDMVTVQAVIVLVAIVVFFKSAFFQH